MKFFRILLVLVMSLMVGILICVESCNEALCGSIVSKCMLTKACSCDLRTRLCSKDCFSCLGYLYIECCSCVDMCPKHEESSNSLGTKSHVEDYLETVPELFSVLTEFPDELERWNIETYPVKFDIDQYIVTKGVKTQVGTDEQKVGTLKTDAITLSCTVVFWSQCLSWTKCKSSCLSMGSSSYRWFHDGCCECIGQHCINYGINEGRCKLCPLTGDADEDISETELDYGEDNVIDYEETSDF